jgi:hypothetical protein
MDEQLKQIFVREILHQTKLALLACLDLNALLEERKSEQIRRDAALAQFNSLRIWYSIQGILIATANISKIFWPNKKYKQRGEALRQLMGMSDDSVLASRDFRNHFEHFDDRLETWASSSARRAFLDSNIATEGMFKGFAVTEYLRNFDLTNMTVTFQGDTYPLRPIVAALEQLHLRVSELHARMSYPPGGG